MHDHVHRNPVATSHGVLAWADPMIRASTMGPLTNQVADRLNSQFTVRSYLKTVYAKLGVRSRAALVFRNMSTFRSAR